MYRSNSPWIFYLVMQLLLKRFFRSADLALSEFQGRGFCVSSLFLLSPPPSCLHQTLLQIQWNAMGIVSSSHVIGIPLIRGSHYMPRWTSVHDGICPGSWSCSRWYDAWCYTIAWFPGIDIRKGCYSDWFDKQSFFIIIIYPMAYRPVLTAWKVVSYAALSSSFLFVVPTIILYILCMSVSYTSFFISFWRMA